MIDRCPHQAWGYCSKCTTDWETAQKNATDLLNQMGGNPQRMDESDARFVTKDSGARQQFESGMVRDVTTGKIEWHRTSDGPMHKRWAELLTRGNVKYPDVEPGVPNWTLANGDAERARFKQSAYRHFMQWYRDEIDEDHAAAVFFNINGYEYVKERLKKNG
jgi:hypothetical protein